MTLNQEYLAWIASFNLTHLEADAEEMLRFFSPILSQEQITWLQDFIVRWDAATPQEQWGEADSHSQEISAQLCEEADQALLTSAL
jgi:hypothetical protein